MAEAENHVLPGGTNDTWRTWLMTGARHRPIDRRRMRGDHIGLKRMLLEGMSESTGRPHVWKDFSGAMIRHAIDDAMRSLPAQEMQVVKLAYFGGYSNREIAEQVGLTEGTVQRRLKRALSAISEQIQHGRALARRALYAVTLWLTGRWLTDGANHLVQSAAVVATAVIIVAQPAPSSVAPPPSSDNRAQPTTAAPGATIAPSAPAQPVGAAPPAPKVQVPPAPNVQVPPAPTVQVPPVNLPVSLPSPSPPPVKI